MYESKAKMYNTGRKEGNEMSDDYIESGRKACVWLHIEDLAGDWS